MQPIEKLRQKKKEVIEGAPAEVKKRLFYDKGMLPPRERIEKLVDPGTFFELDMLATHHCADFGMDKKVIPAEGVITGFGQIHGRKVCVYSQDFSALGGTYGEMTGKIGQYHLRVPYKESYKLIRHIRTLHNSKSLGQISLSHKAPSRNSGPAIQCNQTNAIAWQALHSNVPGCVDKP